VDFDRCVGHVTMMPAVESDGGGGAEQLAAPAQLPTNATVRRACIDIGSNTTRLLVAECTDDGIIEVHQERVFTHIGRDRLAGGAIPESKIAEVAAVVTAQVQTARDLGAADVRAVATAAIRRAPNGVELGRSVGEASGLEVHVLTGREEARLAFVGAARSCGRVPAGELGVVDVGGGSSELVVGSVPDRVSWSVSFALGTGDLAGNCLKSDPPTAGELAAARTRVESMLGELEVPRPVEAVAVGGSAASLASLAGPLLDAAAFARSLGELAAAPALEVARRFGLEVERVRLLPAGLLILQVASELFAAPLTIAGGGLREGVLLEASCG
jgi:exopolyphosphatase/guanosine-5'-triphosphate,3'-diphosphate pyrophosphatase